MSKNREQAQLLKVLAHPARLDILRYMMSGPKRACKANEVVDISQPNLSQHLRTLRESGLLAFEKVANKRCYYVRKPEFVDALLTLLDKRHKTVSISREQVLIGVQD